ncbi:hypothetical protein [uncultured Prevotella sp.]|uniref:hypothetical protein n=1 Tax=uncultured Prevotella sp. TaxID=159272 RepID=UPI0025E1808D|nr:hypothetical protein [uncultured Prevotella sp.]
MVRIKFSLIVLLGLLLFSLGFVACENRNIKVHKETIDKTNAGDIAGNELSQLSLDSLYQIGLPQTAKLEDYNDDYLVFLNHDKKAEYDEDAFISSLYVFDNKTKQLSKLLTTTEPKQYSWVMPAGDKSEKCKISDIHAIYEARLFPYAKKVIISGVFDMRNSLSYIIDLDDKSVLFLPTNGGLVGFTMEEGYAIMQSYKYNEALDEEGVPLGGRHTLLSVFDENGRNIKSLDLNNQGIK